LRVPKILLRILIIFLPSHYPIENEFSHNSGMLKTIIKLD
jgi:hypothetical protein